MNFLHRLLSISFRKAELKKNIIYRRHTVEEISGKYFPVGESLTGGRQWKITARRRVQVTPRILDTAIAEVVDIQDITARNLIRSGWIFGIGRRSTIELEAVSDNKSQRKYHRGGFQETHLMEEAMS